MRPPLGDESLRESERNICPGLARSLATGLKTVSETTAADWYQLRQMGVYVVMSCEGTASQLRVALDCVKNDKSWSVA